MTAKEALESIMLRAKEGRNKEQQKYIESNYELVKQSLTELEGYKKSDASKEQSSIYYFNEFKRAERELEELKKDISRFLYLQTGRIPFTGAFVQDFIIENKPHPLAHESAVERNLKKEYRNLKNKLIDLVGDKDE
jgi:hypothetical protein